MGLRAGLWRRALRFKRPDAGLVSPSPPSPRSPQAWPEQRGGPRSAWVTRLSPVRSRASRRRLQGQGGRVATGERAGLALRLRGRARHAGRTRPRAARLATRGRRCRHQRRLPWAPRMLPMPRPGEALGAHRAPVAALTALRQSCELRLHPKAWLERGVRATGSVRRTGPVSSTSSPPPSCSRSHRLRAGKVQERSFAAPLPGEAVRPAGGTRSRRPARHRHRPVGDLSAAPASPTWCRSDSMGSGHVLRRLAAMATSAGCGPGAAYAGSARGRWRGWPGRPPMRLAGMGCRCCARG